MTRTLRTVRYLKPIQVYGRVYRPKPRLAAFQPLPTRPDTGPWRPTISRADPHSAPNSFTFLNQSRQIENWNDPAIPKLWLYHLHYCDAADTGLIAQWIARNPIGQGAGWEPYPLSRRICNWIKFHHDNEPLSPGAQESLAVQAEYLSQSVEHHLLANHLFANAKALVFAGAFFHGPAAARWLSSGLNILNAQISEQILDDGGHFERSPMYHSLILEDVLDLVNLARAYPGLLPDWSSQAAVMLGWLLQMSHPDGEISFFNDAAFGIASTPAALLAYARRLALGPQSVPLGASGYVRLGNKRSVVLFDAAPIGPDYQPGHAHADTLSFELSVEGRRQIVNSGTSTYENNSQRHAERGTAAHNTLRIDGADSSEVWAAFRVARRARPVGLITDRQSFAECAHDGYTRLKPPVTHSRRLDLSQSQLLITDTLHGAGQHRAELFFHLHPESAIPIHLDPKLQRTAEATFWHPEFNRSVSNTTIVGRWAGMCPVQFITRIPLSW